MAMMRVVLKNIAVAALWVFGPFSFVAQADETPWNINIPSQCLVTTNRVEVPISIISCDANSELSGFSGDIIYDCELLGVPSFESGEDDRIKASGVTMESGVYRFSLKTSP